MTLLPTLLSFCLVLRIILPYNLDVAHPIVYEVPNVQEEGGYFGMAVAIRPRAASLDGAWTIQVGAPRGDAESANVREPGTVFRCHTYGPCRRFRVDLLSTGSAGEGIYGYKEKKDGAWIGVSMDIKAFREYERSVVCGHRWINQNLKNPENIDVTYLMTGVCYLQDLNGTSETPARKLLPLVNVGLFSDKIYTPNPYVVDLSTYHWGLGQAGLSVRLTEEPPGVVIGAPGVTHWVGSVVRYEASLNVFVGNFARTDIAKKSRYTYLGYSVAAGRFYKDRKLWFVAGAPRSANYHGEIFTFQFKGSTDNISIRSNFVGSTFGEYFGSSLAVCDVNGDGFDDLIVGAPLFSNKDPDEGKIYVYLGTNRTNFLMVPQVINGRASHGRFGSCIASLGDLDQDGRGDVAIGAPYEDNQKGVIYIFRGFSTGLEPEFTQRISAQEIYPHLRGFGISISSPVDIDGNKYPGLVKMFADVAVGAYLSGHVVLLRSRPVVSLHPNIKTEGISLIDRMDPFINVTLCSRFAGSNAPNYVDIIRVIEIDPLYGRGSLDASKSSIGKKLIRLRLNEILCEIIPIKLNLSGKNYSPLQITVKNEISLCFKAKGGLMLVRGQTAREADGFSKWCPIGNKAEDVKEIPFAGVCGPDNVCRSDLKLSCFIPEFRTGVYIIGSSEHLTLTIGVENSGEPALNSKIKIWSSVKLREYNYEYKGWAESSRKTFWILIDKVVVHNHQSNFSFEIPKESLQEIEAGTNLLLVVDIFTSSSEVDLTNNHCRFSVKLQTETFVNFYSSSSSNSLLMTKSSVLKPTINVTHYYEVQKTGVTTVKEAELTLYIPYHYKSNFLTFEVETSEWMYSSALYKQPEVRENESSHLLEAPQEVITGGKGPPTNRTHFLNCSCAEIQCHVFRIFFTDGIPIGASSYVKVLVSLNISAIDSIKGDKDIIYVTTTGILKYWKFLDGETMELTRSASVGLYSEEERLPVDAHVVALSILAGGFLLSLITAAMVKGNFFKRIKKQELKALKEADASFIYFATGTDCLQTA